MPSRELEQIKQDRERLRREHAAGASGLSVVRALSDSTDQAVSQIWSRVGGPERSSVVALGGYGRRELSPASDVDLVILQRRGPTGTNVVDAAKNLAYELWDAGLELAYAIQTPKEALNLSRQRLDVATTFLDARLITGDEGLFAECMESARGQRSRWPERFLKRLTEATEARRASAGDAGEELEPNLKDGRGGLRDLVTISWIEQILSIQPEVLREDLSVAADFLHRVRNELHFSTGRRSDVLLMQYQDRVATSLLGERGDVAREDVLMQTLYRHCRHIAFEADGLLFSREASATTPTGVSRLISFLKARPSGEAPGDQLKAFEAPIQEPWPQEVRKAFIEIIKGGHKSRAFQALEQSARLLRLLPEWEGIYCLPQRNIYHRYAVDVHTLHLVYTLSRLETSSDELTRRVAYDSKSDEEVLILAGLLHDIGKGGLEDHAMRGEELARSALKRMGVGRDHADEVAWLVRHHLLLSETATRRDIGDERLLAELAETIGSERRMRLLFLLSVADGIATGPAGWSPWKASLVGQLFATLNHFLENKELFGKDAIQQVHDRVLALKDELSEFDSSQVDTHIDNMPRAWLLSRPAEVLAQHSKMMLNPPPRDEIRLEASRQPEQVWEVTIVARDRPGLFSKIAGTLSLHGLNIVGAEIYTREDGVALDIFRVEAIGDEDRRFEHLVDDAAKAIKGRLSLDVRLAEKRRDYAGRVAKGKREPPQVVVDNQTSDFYTIVEVHASDRIGLLYTITRALADMELDIHLAKIATYAEDVVDVFYVRDLDSQKVVDPDYAKEIERTILYRLGAEE